MVKLLNGEDRGPLAGWSIVCVQGQTLLGRMMLGAVRTLDPVYSLTCVMQMIQPDPRRPPQLMTLRQATPLLTFPSLKSVDISGDAIVIPIERLSSKERRELAHSVEGCEQLMGAMRAEESGLVLAPAGTKLPPVSHQ